MNRVSAIVSLGLVAVMGCERDNPDPREFEIASSEQELVKGTPGAVSGVGDYCASGMGSQCVAGEGDCDFNSHCTGVGNAIADPVICGTDNGLNWGMHQIYDVCVATHCTNSAQDEDETGVDCGGSDCGTCYGCPGVGLIGTFNYCTDGCTCSTGAGDCDDDDDCTGALVCTQDVGARYGFAATLDVCENAACDGRPGEYNGSGSWCTATCPCGPENGDCDNDSHCINGSVCGTDNGPRFGFTAPTDVCVLPHCVNTVQDADETGVDCGGADCGNC